MKVNSDVDRERHPLLRSNISSESSNAVRSISGNKEMHEIETPAIRDRRLGDAWRRNAFGSVTPRVSTAAAPIASRLSAIRFLSAREEKWLPRHRKRKNELGGPSAFIPRGNHRRSDQNPSVGGENQSRNSGSDLSPFLIALIVRPGFRL